ncbi:CLUMA_CG010641, isoform A [Clunio marinus]|uniref:CLUMA_CG010641, isoform A n=1 Tax=Clunio marinus TaxID=568069 RepID=A0A1J1IAD5_9DIPT|nr:CLUMA_CG010641, isoform A [Clunio marinus]
METAHSRRGCVLISSIRSAERTFIEVNRLSLKNKKICFMTANSDNNSVRHSALYVFYSHRNVSLHNQLLLKSVFKRKKNIHMAFMEG